ncbi:MAG: hypothetical protein J7513_04605 [Solirubrobacteraceae bacterium]|nr:hypothetical protein [Solirubrobacteraceae bacterium]
MSSVSPTKHPRALRAVLALLALSALFPGAFATLAPDAFYRSFPLGGGGWVAPLGPPSAHFTSDVGAFYLAFAFLFAWAAWRPVAALVVPLCLAWGGFSTLHALWHTFHLEPFSAADAAAQMVSLVLVLIGPALALVFSRERPPRWAQPPADSQAA